MRSLRYSINVTLDGCSDHRAMFADEDLHRHAAENIDRCPPLWPGDLRNDGDINTGWSKLSLHAIRNRPPVRKARMPPS
jgi:hypothetical protein